MSEFGVNAIAFVANEVLHTWVLVQVNMKKVNMNVMQRWITQRITSLLGFEDDIVVGTCINYLSEEVSTCGVNIFTQKCRC